MDPTSNVTTAELAAQFVGGNLDVEDALLMRAGTGDQEAQRFLAQAMVACAHGEAVETGIRLAMAEVFCRLTAAQGAKLDRRHLARVLSLQASHCRATGRAEAADGHETECLLILNDLADEGWDEALHELTILSGEFSAAAVAAARGEKTGR